VSDHFNITTEDNVVWNADGELAEKGSIEIKTIKEALTVYINPRRRKKQL
jgi:diacylglycerol kinase (ATP)